MLSITRIRGTGHGRKEKHPEERMHGAEEVITYLEKEIIAPGGQILGASPSQIQAKLFKADARIHDFYTITGDKEDPEMQKVFVFANERMLVQ